MTWARLWGYPLWRTVALVRGCIHDVGTAMGLSTVADSGASPWLYP
jgi:hypothetical protein